MISDIRKSAARQYYIDILNKNPKIDKKVAKKMVYSLYPECPEQCLLEIDDKIKGFGKVIIKNNPSLKPSKALREKISKKISILVKEGYPLNQAIAIAYSMVAPKYAKRNPGMSEEAEILKRLYKEHTGLTPKFNEYNFENEFNFFAVDLLTSDITITAINEFVEDLENEFISLGIKSKVKFFPYDRNRIMLIISVR